MAQRQFRSDDTSTWSDKYGTGSAGVSTISSDTTDSSRTGFANTSISVASGNTAATFGSGSGFSDGDLILIHQSRDGGTATGSWELNKISSGGGTTSVTLSYSTCNAYNTTAQVYRLVQNSSITIDSTKTLTASAWDGAKGGIIALLANTSITVTGTITASAKGLRRGTGGTGASNHGKQGEGTNYSLAASRSPNGRGGGGGSASAGAGGSYDGTGGTGGDNDQSTQPTNPSLGTADYTLAFMGAAGGGGGYGSTDGGYGGAGGGIIFLIAPIITVTGSVISGGENGLTGVQRVGGGGAGGFICYKGNVLTLGTNLTTSPAGTSGKGSEAWTATGTSGTTGRIHADYGTSISGTSTPSIDSRVDTSLIPSTGAGWFILF